GFVPYGGTFLSFTDYCRPAIRLAALMKQRVIYVMTHDSIGLGEDGPTHQPVEHVAALRAIPNLQVLRPCDAIETLEAWELALNSTSSPSVLVLTRQGVPALRSDASENKSARGAYVISPASSTPKAVVFATGSEVSLAVAAQKELEGKGIPTQVVSVPSFELFAKQDAAYRASVMGPSGAVKVACEAAIRMGWDALIGNDGAFVGMSSFGESAPAEVLYKHFGITTEAIVDAVMKRV
ncbi:MAG TPA: transketolase C-terminal domain-containing protein, partial [Alphaproteobacteria bacterium]|nr:transketolase C-terminal domain-containing protein [Alphaproteobacteria bacterium]